MPISAMKWHPTNIQNKVLVSGFAIIGRYFISYCTSIVLCVGFCNCNFACIFLTKHDILKKTNTFNVICYNRQIKKSIGPWLILELYCSTNYCWLTIFLMFLFNLLYSNLEFPIKLIH